MAGLRVVSNVFLCVYSFRRSEGGACFLVKEFEAENSQRVEGVVELF